MELRNDTVKQIIDEQYKRGHPQRPDDCWVIDRRSGRANGPYSRESALTLAVDLNGFLGKNGIAVQPFTAHSSDGEQLNPSDGLVSRRSL